MNAVLIGLNENNEELAKKIYALCDKIARCYGRSWIDGAVWVNILKSPKVRIAGFKYFLKTFKDRDKIKRENLLMGSKELGDSKDLKEIKEVKEKEKEKDVKEKEGKEIQEVMTASFHAEQENNLQDSVFSDSGSPLPDGNCDLLSNLLKRKNL
jgi:hypothetical protein